MDSEHHAVLMIREDGVRMCCYIIEKFLHLFIVRLVGADFLEAIALNAVRIVPSTALA